MTTLKKAYAIKDIKAEMFSQMPMFVNSNGLAIRSFATACEDDKTDFNKYPEDFSLYEIGTYCMETATLTTITPKQIANASEFVEKQ